MTKPTSTPADSSVQVHDVFVDREELARRLEVHSRTVGRMIARGELPRPCLSVGGRPRWLCSYLVDYCRRRHEREDHLDQYAGRKLR